jgi:hypothetical protein
MSSATAMSAIIMAKPRKGYGVGVLHSPGCAWAPTPTSAAVASRTGLIVNEALGLIFDPSLSLSLSRSFLLLWIYLAVWLASAMKWFRFPSLWLLCCDQ